MRRPFLLATPGHPGFARRLCLIAGGALVLRVAYVVGLAGNHYSEGPVGDSRIFHDLANLLADGRGFISPFRLEHDGVTFATAEHPPLWPLTLAVFSKAFGADILTHRLVGAGLGAVVVALLGLVAFRLAGAKAGLAAALLGATSPLLIAADGSLMSETLFGALLLGAVLAALAVRDRPTPARAALLGALIGAAALTRGEGLALMALLAVPAAWRPSAGRATRIAAALLATLVVLAPWTIRNWLTFDQLVVVSNNSGTLASGANCPLTYHGELLGFWTDGCLRPAAPGDDEAEYADRLLRQGGRYAREHAGRLVGVVIPVRVLRTLNLWDPVDQVRLSEGTVRGVEAAGQVWFWLLVPLGVYGAILLRRRRTGLWLLLVPVGLSALVTVGGYGYPRFRHGADLALTVLAGLAVAALWERRGRTRPA